MTNKSPMNYRFPSETEFFLFQDAFSEYLVSPSKPFGNLIACRFEYKTHGASYAIGAAHMDQFRLVLSKHPFSPLGQDEDMLSNEVFLQMNVAIIRHEIETECNPYPDATKKAVAEFHDRFPCTFSYHEECTLTFPQQYEDLLDKILVYYDALADFDPKGIAAHLEPRYEGLDSSWLLERLQFLHAYFKGDSFLSRIRKTVAAMREASL